MSQSFRCRVVDKEGRACSIERSAASLEALKRELSREGYAPIECRPLDAAPRRKKLSLKEVLQFTEELELLFAQSLGLKDALRVLSTIKTSRALASLVADLENSLAKGRSMADALAEFGGGFPPLYIGLVRVGELTGTLKTVLPRLSAYLEDRRNLRDRIRGALMYPSLVMLVLIVGMALLTVFVLPVFIGVADSLGSSAGSALRSRLVAFQALFVGILAAIPLVFALFAFLRSRAASTSAIDNLLLRLPFVGRFLMCIEMRTVSFAMETLLESGYTADVALAECVQVCGNHAVATALSEACKRTTKGERLSRALRETGVLPAVFCSWIAVGEEAHDVTKAFSRLRSHYDREFEKTSKTIMTLIEPVLIILVGAVLFAVVIQFIGPIYGLLGGGT